jgi:hypothetical protein
MKVNISLCIGITNQQKDDDTVIFYLNVHLVVTKLVPVVSIAHLVVQWLIGIHKLAHMLGAIRTYPQVKVAQ